MKILITGGAGFLGSNLALKLLEQGHNVVALDNFRTSDPSNIKHLKEFNEFSFIEQDVIDPFDIECDQVYNLACPASPPLYQIDPLYTAAISYQGTLNALEHSRNHSARVFHASTSEVYGDPHEHPQTESYRGNVNTLGPRACYDEGKRFAETLCADYHRVYGANVCMARIFNTYGPRMNPDDGRVVSNFIVQALQGNSITIYGDGSQTRSFCYVDDLIHGFDLLMNSQHNHHPINLGNPDEFTVRQLAEIVIEKINPKLELIFHSLPEDDPLQRKPNIEKAKEILNWEPKVTLTKGLDKTIQYFDRVLSKK